MKSVYTKGVTNKKRNNIKLCATANMLLMDVDDILQKYAKAKLEGDSFAMEWLSTLYLQLYDAYQDLIKRMFYRKYKEYDEKMDYYRNLFSAMYEA